MSGESARVPHRVDDARVTAAAENHQATVSEPDHECVIIEDQRVCVPASVAQRLMSVEPRLEWRGPIDLARDQHGAIEQEREGYRLPVDFDQERAWLPVLMDEPAPLSGGAGLNASGATSVEARVT